MKTPQQHAQKILPLVTAQANGEVIQMYVGDEWYDCMEPIAFIDGCKYRVKPKTILVNGFEVPEPMREEPVEGECYRVADPLVDELYNELFWIGSNINDRKYLSRGICHTTKEAAIAHAKAMLGIDPKDGE